MEPPEKYVSIEIKPEDRLRVEEVGLYSFWTRRSGFCSTVIKGLPLNENRGFVISLPDSSICRPRGEENRVAVLG